MLKKLSEQKEMHFHYSMMDVKMAIENHGLQCIMDALFSDNNYAKELEKYLTEKVNSSTIEFAD